MPHLPEKTIEAIREAIEKGGVLLYMESYGGKMYVYANGYMWYLNLNGKGVVETAATMSDKSFGMHMMNRIMSPKPEDVRPLPEEMKAEVEKKLTGKAEDYMALIKDGKLSVGGGMTTEQSFTVGLKLDTPEDIKKAQDYIIRVMNPESFGYFIFH